MKGPLEVLSEALFDNYGHGDLYRVQRLSRAALDALTAAGYLVVEREDVMNVTSQHAMLGQAQRSTGRLRAVLEGGR